MDEIDCRVELRAIQLQYMVTRHGHINLSQYHEISSCYPAIMRLLCGDLKITEGRRTERPHPLSPSVGKG